MLVTNLACHPYRKIWDVTIQSGTCIHTLPFTIFAAFSSAISDIIIFSLPQQVIWKLQMPSRQKLQVSALFCIGLL